MSEELFREYEDDYIKLLEGITRGSDTLSTSSKGMLSQLFTIYIVWYIDKKEHAITDI